MYATKKRVNKVVIEAIKTKKPTREASEEIDLPE
tara:strand:- start:2855 stop:2956 length:102 start_codon:yes stop_codon:yes gene_type:complete